LFSIEFYKDFCQGLTRKLEGEIRSSEIGPKQCEMAGEVEHYRQELQRLSEGMGNVDATINLLYPSYDPH
jgi:hypothetical protein